MLPLEVWISIASLSTQDAVRNMCLVCKDFCSVMQPQLFQHYIQPGYPDESTLQPFLRICLARPDLAAAVKKATVYCFDNWQEFEEISKNKRRQETRSGWQLNRDRQIEKLHSERWPTPVAANDNKRVDILGARNLALLCSLLPNLEHLILDIPVSYLEVGPAFDYARTHWSLPTPFLSQLRLLQLDFAFEEDGVDLHYLRSLVSLSSLKTLQVHRCQQQNDDDDGFPQTSIEPQKLSIEHLNFMCSVISHGRLKELIERCNSLKTFQLVYGEIMTGAIVEYDFEIVSNAFLAHTGCLESLKLDFEGSTAIELLEKDEIRGVMTMSSFECLRHIDLPAWGMVPVNQSDDDQSPCRNSISKLLPRSLQSLVVRSCNEHTVLPLWGLLASLDTLPNLKEIAFTGEPGANLEGLEGFQNACKEKGIELNKNQ